jgi:hypothetical protein
MFYFHGVTYLNNINMRLRFGVEKARYIFSSKHVLSPQIFNLTQSSTTSSIASNYGYNNESKNEGWNPESNWKLALKCFAVAGLTSFAADNLLFRKDLLADEKEELDAEQEIINKENR